MQIRIMASLCLACASSLPVKSTVFHTRCCKSPICPNCIESSPRLARYDPCLQCLGGVSLVSTAFKTDVYTKNIDGAVRDEDTYVIGDDDSDEEEETNTNDKEDLPNSEDKPQNTAEPTGPPKYYIKPNDTLRGIALRFAVEGRALCVLNKLPSTTLTTTPHLLHTRTFLIMPPSVAHKLQDEDPAVRQNAEVRRARECAAKCLQTLTKEVDWQIAQTYVALADDPDLIQWKRKENGIPQHKSMELLAVETYLEDNEWEQQERQAGRGVEVKPFPFASKQQSAPIKQKSSIWTLW